MKGYEIKQIIKARGLKQKFIADQIGLDYGLFSKWLNGKYDQISQSKIYRIYEVLEINN
jgi:transcriptional regulator with XRE-family HTH domain